MIKEIDANELKAVMDSGDQFQLIDCREQQEWNECHIAGATLIPLSEFEQKYEAILADKNAHIILQCRSGKRSLNACMFLMSKGYTDLTNVEGGIMGWMNEGYPVLTKEN
jgi:rhodanese-related sulfurtransferase